MTNRDIFARKIGYCINVLIAILLYIGYGLLCEDMAAYNERQEAAAATKARAAQWAELDKAGQRLVAYDRIRK